MDGNSAMHLPLPVLELLVLSCELDPHVLALSVCNLFGLGHGGLDGTPLTVGPTSFQIPLLFGEFGLQHLLALLYRVLQRPKEDVV